MLCNRELSDTISSLIGEGWKKDAQQLQKLLEYTQEEVLQKLLQIKQNNKHRLAQEFAAQGILVDENSIYDIQIKRLHEYKRQQMNALYAIWKYFEILDGRLPSDRLPSSLEPRQRLHIPLQRISSTSSSACSSCSSRMSGCVRI